MVYDDDDDDDVVIMGIWLQDAEEIFVSLISKTDKTGLEIYDKKTKFKTVSWKPYNKNECIKLGTCNFEIVKEYLLGTILTYNNEWRLEIGKRNVNANRAYYAFLPVLKNKSVLRAEKNKNL
jgi:hypothetical protein